ncbi:hypothetical protein AB0M02_44245 [Actinoplanes sp. NPDC051861]|uniref:hypothetical protein n=1 Tax=Actinoplanes sp. NPDC051861 TaxID=3155170 RepID=UPI003412021C
MSEIASIDDLFDGDDVTADVHELTLPNGKVVKVRGLSRYELILAGKGTEDGALIERRNIQMCMVEPAMTLGQVEAWQKRSRAGGGGYALVSKTIRDLSGLGEGADKSDLRAVRDES